jgi:hypothetical protein
MAQAADARVKAMIESWWVTATSVARKVDLQKAKKCQIGKYLPQQVKSNEIIYNSALWYWTF